MTTLTKVVFDDTDSAMSYDSSWTQIRTVTPWSSEFSATAHRADNSGATGTFTYSGKWNIMTPPIYFHWYHPLVLTSFNGYILSMIFIGATMMVIGTLDSPATYGYPSVTYILDDGEPVTLDLSTTISKYINTTGVTTGVVLYTSGPKPEGAHTVKWTVNNVSPSGPRFYLDAFWVFRQTISSTDPLYYTVYDTRSGFQYGPNARDSGIMGGYTGTDASGEPSIQSFSYTFEGM